MHTNMKLKRKEKKRDKERKKTYQNVWEIYKKRIKGERDQKKLIVIECESIWIKDQEHNKILQCISSEVPVPIKSSAIMQYMPPRLDWIVVTWICEIHVREKS